MTNASPLALAFDQFISTVLAQATAPLLARIEALEQRVDNMTGEKFDEAVLEVLRDQPTAVVDLLEDEIKECVSDSKQDDLNERVVKIIRDGSFNVTFDRH